MPPVEQRPPPPGNPGASLYVRRRHGQRRAGASAATARRAGGGHGASAGSDSRPRAGRRRAPGASRRGRKITSLARRGGRSFMRRSEIIPGSSVILVHSNLPLDDRNQQNTDGSQQSTVFWKPVAVLEQPCKSHKSDWKSPKIIICAKYNQKL